MAMTTEADGGASAGQNKGESTAAPCSPFCCVFVLARDLNPTAPSHDQCFHLAEVCKFRRVPRLVHLRKVSAVSSCDVLDQRLRADRSRRRSRLRLSEQSVYFEASKRSNCAASRRIKQPTRHPLSFPPWTERIAHCLQQEHHETTRRPYLCCCDRC